LGAGFASNGAGGVRLKRILNAYVVFSSSMVCFDSCTPPTLIKHPLNKNYRNYFHIVILLSLVGMHVTQSEDTDAKTKQQNSGNQNCSEKFQQ
jgi:hypothetical protein